VSNAGDSTVREQRRLKHIGRRLRSDCVNSVADLEAIEKKINRCKQEEQLSKEMEEVNYECANCHAHHEPKSLMAH